MAISYTPGPSGVITADLIAAIQAEIDATETALQSNITAGDAALQSQITANDADILATRTGLVHANDRPGDNVLMFSGTLSGEGIDRTPLAAVSVVTNDLGKVYSVTGAGYILARNPVAISQDVIEVLARVRRDVDPLDPSNHAVQLVAVWLDKDKAVISETALAENLSLLASDGLVELSARISALPAAQNVTAPPSGAVYATLGIRQYGDDGALSVETVRVKEVTDLHGLSQFDLSQVVADAEAATTAANNAVAALDFTTVDGWGDVAVTDLSAAGAVVVRYGIAEHDGLGGVFAKDVTDTTSAHNPPEVLVSSDGSRFRPLQHDFEDVSAVLTSAAPSYPVGSILRARSEGYSYSVADPAATDHHVTTAGGVKLYVLPQNEGFPLDAFGTDGTRPGDSAAIIAAIAAADGAPITLEAKRYLWDSSAVFSADFCLEGAQMPRVNASVTALEDGSIIDGEFGFTSSNVQIRNMGFDVGADSTALERDDACRGTAPLDAGGRLHVENVVGLCDARNRTGHALLFQSYQEVTGGNLYGVYSTFGVVLKCQNVNLGLVRSFENQNSGVLIKSDTGFGRVENVYINRVEAVGHRGADNGFHIQSSDRAARKIQIGSVDCKGFETNVFIQCGASGIDVRDVTIGEIYSTEAFTHDLIIDADNATSLIADVHIGRLSTNETKAQSVRTRGNGDTYGLSIGSAFINYRTAAVQADMDQAVFFGANTDNTSIGQLEIVRNYFQTLKGTITYSAGQNTLGLYRANVIGAGSPFTRIYNTTGGTEIDIDIGNCNQCTIVVNNLSLSSAAGRILWQLSEDGGATVESGTVYRRAYVDSVVDDAFVSTFEIWSPATATANVQHGKIEIMGQSHLAPTSWSGYVASVADNEARLVSGVVSTATRYDTLKFIAQAGTFDAVDIVVYKQF